MDIASGLAWPVTHLNSALEQLARASGLHPRSGAPLPSPPPRIDTDRDALGRWVEQTCRRLDLEAEPTEIPYNDVERSLCDAGPALLMLRSPDGASFLPLIETRRRVAVILGRDGRRHRVRISELAARLRHDLDTPLAPMVQTLLAEAGIAALRRPRASLAILRDHIGSDSSTARRRDLRRR